MNKKQIYNNYGVEYKNNKILSPVGWVNPLLVNGNAKLGKGVYTFSTLPTNKNFTVEINGETVEIKGTCPCHCDGCYATKGFYNMPSVLKSNAIKTLLARDFLDFVERAISAQIEAENIRLLRIHASGDFFSDEYIAMWHRICECFPDTVFWTYTKNQRAESAFDDLKNINVVKSVVKGFGFNFGHCGYILRVYKALRATGESVYICRCGIDKNQHCNNCRGCSEHTFVLFVEHSTEYNAESDPDYTELVKTIEAQC